MGETADTRNQKVVQYILKKLEEDITGNSIDLSTNKFNIEHVLPQKITDGWVNFNDVSHAQNIYRLGNMVILEKSINGDIGNQDYSVKQTKLTTSTVKLTSGLAERYDDWTPNSIESRQKYLSKRAKSIWRIPNI